MRRTLLAVAALALCARAGADTPLLVSPDVPTLESASLSTLLEAQVHRYAVPASYSLELWLSGNPVLDGIQKLDRAQTWLFSVEAASDLGGALGGAKADPRDVIRFDEGSGTASFFFCGGLVGIPPGANLDALHVRGGDGGDLLLSFDVPFRLGSLALEPADLARFQRTGGGCADWAAAALNPDFDASAAGNGIPLSVNLIGAEQIGDQRLLSFDVPVRLGPPGVTSYVPGQIVSWDGASFALYENLVGWPAGSGVDGLSSIGNPGRVPPTIRLAKTATPQLNASPVEIRWSASCSAGASYYAIYEGTLGVWYSHGANDCSDDLVPFTEVVTPSAGNRYFLVVPHNGTAEGSYGTSGNWPQGSNTERPVGTAACDAPQVITPCP